MGYIGCGTKKNKILWGVFAGLVLVAAILLGVGMGQFPVCRKKLPGTCNPNNSNMSRTRASQLPPDCRQIFVRCWRPFLIMSAIGVVALILALATTCIMCCCSKPPNHAQQCQADGVQMATASVANPYHQSYEHSGQQQPYAPYPQQQQQQQHPYTAGYNYPAGQQQHPYTQQQQQQQQHPQQPYPVAPGYPYQQQQAAQQPFQQHPYSQQGTQFAAARQPAFAHPQAAAGMPPTFSGAAAPYPQVATSSNVPVQHI